MQFSETFCCWCVIIHLWGRTSWAPSQHCQLSWDSLELWGICAGESWQWYSVVISLHCPFFASKISPIYRKVSNISCTKSPNLNNLILSCSCLCPIHWTQVLSREWRCSWSSTDRRCSNYIWVINNFIAFSGAAYIRDLTVYLWACLWGPGMWCFIGYDICLNFSLFVTGLLCATLCYIGLWYNGTQLYLQHTEAKTRWPSFSRRHFQMHFIEWRCLNFAWYFTEVCS